MSQFKVDLYYYGRKFGNEGAQAYINSISSMLNEYSFRAVRLYAILSAVYGFHLAIHSIRIYLRMFIF